MAEDPVDAELESPTETPPATDVLRRVGRLFTMAARRRTIVLFVALAFAAGLLEAGSIVVVVAIAATLADGADAVAIDFGPVDTSLTTTGGVVLGLGLTVALVACALPAAWLEAHMGANVLRSLRSRLFVAVAHASWTKQSQVLEARFQDLSALHAYRVANMVLIATRLVTNALNLAALVLAAFILDVSIALSLVVVVVVLAVVFRPLIRSVGLRSEAHLSAHLGYVDRVANTFNVLPELRVFNVRSHAVRDLAAVNDETAVEYRHMMFRGRLLPSMYLGATMLLLLVGLLVAGAQDGIDLARIGAIVLFLLRSLRYSQQVQGGWQGVVEQLPYADSIEEALAEWTPDPTEFGGRTLDRVDTIEFRDVRYAYPTGEVGIDGVSMTLRRGEIIGLEGPSGAGKSTIAQLVLGLRRPTSGSILIDGTPVQEFDEHSWFERFAYVAQDSRLIQGDVRANVRFLRPDVTDEQIDRALDRAGIADDVARWVDGADREVGVSGRELSGGQRQRIAIARALVGDPDVLVLDEPTSALDPASEQIVRSTIASLRGSVTVVLVAHRESTLSICDRVLTVGHQHVVERAPSSLAE